jgi:lysophospholipase L1-like esterase
VIARTIGAAALVLLAAACGGDDGGNDEADPPKVERMVALGDSFVAGEGASPYDEASGRCRRSPTTWPRVLDELDDGYQLVDLRACGGARTEHLLEPWTDRDQPAQIPQEPDPSVDLVVLMIGGNDAGFGDVSLQCVFLDCSGVPASAGWQGKLATLSQTLAEQVYPRLRTAYPEARLVHVTYPYLTPAEAPTDPACGWLTEREVPATRQLVADINDAITSAARSFGDDDEVEVLDASGAFAGHELCTEQSEVHPITLDADRAHPTTAGYASIAQTVRGALR